MRLLALCLSAVGVLASAERVITNREIRREAKRLEAIATREPPLMGLDTLVETAAVEPYTPEAARRLLRQAARRTERHPGIGVSYTVVRHWMDLDPAGAEAALRRLEQRRHTLDALISYYQRRGDQERVVALATEAIRAPRKGSFDEQGPWGALAESRPLEAVDLFLQSSQDPAAQGRLPDSALALLMGLIRASETQPQAVKEAAARLKPLLLESEFGKESRTLVTTSFELDGRKVDTKDNRSTALESLGLVERLADPAGRASAQEALRTRRVRYELRGAMARRNPVPAELPLERAIEEIRQVEPARIRLGELWRYLIGKPRTEEEAGPIVRTLIEWAERAPAESDPAWFLRSLLNLDGRLGPPGKQWVLPAGLRPTVFQAAARAAQTMDRDPDALADLVEAMRAEKVSVPADLVSARARVQLGDLRAKLEQRFDFTLPSLTGTMRGLRAERGKVVVLNFWATWCGPCRAELPVLDRVYRDLGKESLEIFAISDEDAEKVKSLAATNQLVIPVLLDDKRRVFDHYRVAGIPHTVVLSPSGGVVRQFKSELTEEQLRAAITAARK